MILTALMTAAALAAASEVTPLTVQKTAALKSCVIGMRVVDRQGRTGVITADDGGGCTIRHDNGEKGYSLFWMLEPASATGGKPSGQSGGRLTPGAYQCYGGPAGNLSLTFKAGGQYANAQGKAGAYAMSGADGRFAFTSGPWAGFYGRVLPDGRVGLSSQPNTQTYYMTCDRR